MADRFNAEEVFEMARQIERNGSAFYKKCSELTSDVTVRELFESLADMELDHERIFAELQLSLRTAENAAESLYYDPNHEAILYILALADENVFISGKPVDELLSGRTTPVEFLELALRFEQESIAYFVGMKPLVPRKMGRDKIDYLIEEEKKHVVLLSQMKKSLL